MRLNTEYSVSVTFCLPKLFIIHYSFFIIRHSHLECFPKRDLLRPNVTPGPKRFVSLGVRTSRQSRDWPRVRPLRAPNLFETVCPAAESKESALARRFPHSCSIAAPTSHLVSVVRCAIYSRIRLFQLGRNTSRRLKRHLRGK